MVDDEVYPSATAYLDLSVSVLNIQKKKMTREASGSIRKRRSRQC